MNCAEYLRQLLRPLGVYRLERPFNGGELDAAGQALDQAAARLEELEREGSLATAEDWGLERVAELLARRPVAEDPRTMAAALAALLRIGGDSFTVEAINDTLSGCGVPAVAEERGVGTVRILFPGVSGVPQGVEEMKKIIESILPAHVAAEYWFSYITWAQLEQKFESWSALESQQLTWDKLETSTK